MEIPRDEQEQIVEEEFEKCGLNATAKWKYDTHKQMAFIYVYTYVDDPYTSEQEKYSIEIDILPSIYESPRTEEIIREKAEDYAGILLDEIVEEEVRGGSS